MNQKLNLTNSMKTLTLALGLTAAVATTAAAGTTTMVMAAGGGNYCDEHPEDPICCDSAGTTDEACYPEGEDEFASYLITPPPAGISRYRFERYAPLPGGTPLVGARSAGGKVWCWGSNAAQEVKRITGEAGMPIVVPTDGIEPTDITYNEQRRTYEVLSKDGSIVEIEPATGSRTELLPPWVFQSAARAAYLVKVKWIDHPNPTWLIAVENYEPDWHQLFSVELVWGVPRVSTVGQARMFPFIAIGAVPDGPLIHGYAVDAGGTILAIEEDLTFSTIGTFPEAPSCAVISSAGDEAFALTTEGKLYKADLASGLVSLVGSSGSLKYRVIITNVDDSPTSARVVATYNAANKTISFVSEKGDRLPNFRRSMKVSEIIGVEPAAQLRMATGKFVGELVGDPNDPQMALAQYDPSRTSTAAAKVHLVSLRYVDDRGYPAVLKTFEPYGSTNKVGVTLATYKRADGPDALITGPGPGPTYGPHVTVHAMDGGEMAKKVSFYAYSTLKNGVNVAAGDVDGDGATDIITGPGPGQVFGAHVRGFRINPVTLRFEGALSKVNFMAFESRYGADVAVGDVNGDGRDDIVVGAGAAPSNGARVRAFTLGAAGIETLPLNFMIGNSGGALVSAGDVDGDALAEVIATGGADPTGAVYLIERPSAGGGYQATSFNVGPGRTNAAVGIVGGRADGDAAGVASPVTSPSAAAGR